MQHAAEQLQGEAGRFEGLLVADMYMLLKACTLPSLPAAAGGQFRLLTLFLISSQMTLHASLQLLAL